VLTEYFLGHLHPEILPYKISKRASECFMAYHWPGNVRELRNVIERAIILSDNELLTAHSLPPEIIASGQENNECDAEHLTMEQHEKELILRVLNIVANNRNQAAKMLHIGRKTLYRKMRKFNIPG
jgi:two-component system NtrC family response regulator